ncbi:MAG: recombinase family protein, partial [Ruminococcus sp.]|nr:recombinase family protein [Ruminococcus sp.]
MSDPVRKVHKIESKIGLFADAPEASQRKKRVAAYARVSTDSEEQLSSYEAQVGFYTRHIQGNPDWEFVRVYTDEGISGTNIKKREGFNRMIRDALNGKIDLILTKSISRFARNTVDTLTTIRKLKEKGIEVYFEKENIYTLDAKGEVMITIMSSLAQEESRSISENVTWGIRKSMEDGKVSLGYKHFLGYEKGADGLPQIVEEEAETVRKIYRLFLDGRTVRSIAEQLTDEGIPTPSGKKNWSVSTIMSILQNEKYKGDALLQKTYTVDFLSKKVKKNKGEIPQYYIQNSHPAIIDPDTFELVQNEIKRRRPGRRH